MITNENGYVAIAYIQPIPKLVKLDGGVTYFFDVKRAVSLAWVAPEHANQVLAITKKCCGGHINVAFHPATQSQVNVWLNIGR